MFSDSNNYANHNILILNSILILIYILVLIF